MDQFIKALREVLGFEMDLRSAKSRLNEVVEKNLGELLHQRAITISVSPRIRRELGREVRNTHR